jgi:3-methylcrotonyl-CoA carboxylase alpha subunit
MFSKLLIANRGEIACRIMRTARAMGIGTVAVYSDADRHALHVALADEAVHIGAPAAAESYLRIDTIIDAALRSGAGAIHPGYGFLSENAGFAAACTDNGLVFIGPPPAAITAMGSKARAKQLMEAAGVPLVPGYHGEEQSLQTLHAGARAMGYPVLLKAVAGGGGKGMRAVHDDSGFEAALAGARREAQASFGDDRMLVEKLIERPRHVEVQVFCDDHGGAVYLAERDCSIQRRHQKVIEEAPAPGLAPELRQAMGQAAVAAARAIDYRGAGTVEFLLDDAQQFYFMEMNTRLQVEHPVTEMITGQDLVEWQLRIAAGEPLPLAQEAIRIQGHAIEARIYAEDTQRDFLPATGRIDFLRLPREDARLRIDTGVREGSEISPWYDPMIAKLIVHGDTRSDAQRRLKRALAEFRLRGPATNIEFLYNIASSAGFASADLDTHFIERHHEVVFRDRRGPLTRDLAAASLALLQLRERANRAIGSADCYSPWQDSTGWRLNVPHRQLLSIHCHGRDHAVVLEHREQGGYHFEIEGQRLDLHGAVEGERLTLEMNGHRLQALLATGSDCHTLFWDDGACEFSSSAVDLGDHGAADGADNDFSAPMHGSVVAMLVQPHEPVAAGAGLIVLEAMKTEQTLRAPCAGSVTAFHCQPGDLVDRGQRLLDFEAAQE